jgi:hypothetical protein
MFSQTSPVKFSSTHTEGAQYSQCPYWRCSRFVETGVRQYILQPLIILERKPIKKQSWGQKDFCEGYITANHIALLDRK